MKFPLILDLCSPPQSGTLCTHIDIPRIKAESFETRISLSREMVLVTDGK